MDLAAVLFLIALLLAVSLYLVTPLMGNRSSRVTEDTQETSSLLAERERLLNALQELDFDFNLGKIPAEDYPAQRAELLQKGTEILKKLDALAPLRPPTVSRPAAAEVSATEQTASLSDDEIESMLAARRKARKTKAAGFCPRCGKPILITDQFCPSCGKALQ
jgi:hypothetical protein